MNINSDHGVALVARGLKKGFKVGRGRTEVLKDVDFDARHGDVTMVMGPSGSGKSTLVAALSGLLRPDAGEVVALEQSLWKQSNAKIDKFRLDHCGFIFQGFNLFSALTALEQVTTVLKYKGYSPKEARRKAEISLKEVGLEQRLNQRPSELSGGEKQRVVRRRTNERAGRRKWPGSHSPAPPRRHRTWRSGYLCHPRSSPGKLGGQGHSHRRRSHS